VHVGDDDATLNSGSELLLRGCAARQLRAHAGLLRKLNGIQEARAAAVSVRTKDASLCSAVIQPLVARVGRWVVDASVALLE